MERGRSEPADAGEGTDAATESVDAAASGADADAPPGAASNLGVAVLVLVNLTPLAAVLLFGWSLFDVIFLYWLESAVIGFYNVLKLLVVANVLCVILVPFFLFHYGFFMSIHASLLSGFFGTGQEVRGDPTMWRIFWDAWQNTQLPITLLVVSHGVSFVANFLLGKEYRRTSIGDLMEGPYKRIFIMQATVILGGFLVLMTGAKTFGLLALIFAKTAADLRAHRSERARSRPGVATDVERRGVAGQSRTPSIDSLPNPARDAIRGA